MSDLDRFYRLKARLKRGEHLTLSERQEYRCLGRAWIQVYKAFPQTKDVLASIKSIKSDMGRVDKTRLKNRLKKVDPMQGVLE